MNSADGVEIKAFVPARDLVMFAGSLVKTH
jgi:hypothetical protein